MTTKQTILIVDDDMDIVREISGNLLEISDQYSIETCDDGKKALEILEKEKMDLVILDILIPVMNGLQLLTELRSRGIWLPIIIITDSNITEKDRNLTEFGIVDFIRKPFLPEKLAVQIDLTMKAREKKDLIKTFGLPSILQLIEMEKRTGLLTINIGKENCRVFFTDGSLMDIEIKGLSTGKALEVFIDSLYEDREISIEYIKHKKEKKINMTLMQLVMEASRIKDEQKMRRSLSETKKQTPNLLQSDYLTKTAELIRSLKEVDTFIISDTLGEVLIASPQNHNIEESVNPFIYLWTIGETLGNEFNFKEPSQLICQYKNKKKFVKRYLDFIIILELSEMTKCSAFKEKLNELLDKLFL